MPRKNIKELAGKPLLAYTIEEARKSKYIDRTVVSTEDGEIAKVAKDFGVEVIERPAELARDETPSDVVLAHAVNFLEKKENYVPDVVILLSPTCPLRKSEQVNEAIEKFISGDCDSLIGVSFVYKHRYETDENGRLIPVVKERKNRQERRPVILENGAIYISKGDLIKEGRILGDKIHYYKMDYKSSVNIDDYIDFLIAEQSLNDEQQKNEN